MDFIFMLTRDDRTVEDAVTLLPMLRPLGLRHIGFKDCGVEPETAKALTDAIHELGAQSYMEVVALTLEPCVAAARMAREAGVQHLLGGTVVDAVLADLAGSETGFYPFAGKPRGHPTRLAGLPDEIEAHCAAFAKAGCTGCDLLAYRATEAQPLALIRAARRGLGPGRRLIIAGDITSRERIAAVKDAGADAFTIGSAIFDGTYAPAKNSFLPQLDEVLADCATLS